LRSARLQGLLEVGSTRLLATMLGALGVSTLRLLKMTLFLFSFFSIKLDMLLASMLGDYSTRVSDALLFSQSYRPVGKPISHQLITRLTLSFLDHHTGHPVRHDTQVLLYECVLDAL
jgi:hypothetical protein